MRAKTPTAVVNVAGLDVRLPVFSRQIRQLQARLQQAPVGQTIVFRGLPGSGSGSAAAAPAAQQRLRQRSSGSLLVSWRMNLRLGIRNCRIWDETESTPLKLNTCST